jgi:hypothetical protein
MRLTSFEVTESFVLAVHQIACHFVIIFVFFILVIIFFVTVEEIIALFL